MGVRLYFQIRPGAPKRLRRDWGARMLSPRGNAPGGSGKCLPDAAGAGRRRHDHGHGKTARVSVLSSCFRHVSVSSWTPRCGVT